MLMPAGNEFEAAAEAPLSATGSPGALPAALRVLGPDQTGPYLHLPAHKMHLSFQGDSDVARSFTVLIALARKDNAIHLDRNGIVVIDNDNFKVIADEIQPQSSGIRGASSEQRKAFEAIPGLNWAEFTHLLRSCEKFRPGVAADVTEPTDMPAPGNAARQIKLGLRKAGDVDLRDDFLRAIHEAGDYSFPRATRTLIINSLLMHPKVAGRDGLQLSWDVRMNYAFNTSGKVTGGEEVDPALDARWTEAYAADESLMITAGERALAPYLQAPFSALEMDDAECELEARGSKGGFVVLGSFNGQKMCFADPRDMRLRLEAMDDGALMRLWAATRVLDADLGRANRAAIMAEELNTLRAEMEPQWEEDIEQELSF